MVQASHNSHSCHLMPCRLRHECKAVCGHAEEQKGATMVTPAMMLQLIGKNVIHFSICACHPCAGAMLIFSVSFQFSRMTSEEDPKILFRHAIKQQKMVFVNSISGGVFCLLYEHPYSCNRSCGSPAARGCDSNLSYFSVMPVKNGACRN